MPDPRYTPTLVEWLTARLADDETTWRTVYAPTNPMGVFLLADVAAKRKIVEDRPLPIGRFWDGQRAQHDSTLRALASVYGDAPGFRDEWRP